MPKNKTIAIIPARGGSKRLPEKNLLTLDGKTLLQHSIDYAKANSAIINMIVVSTDNTAIKNEALSLGVKVVDRPLAIAGDRATTVSALQDVLEQLDGEFETVVLLQPTNPLRPKALLEDAFKLYKEADCDSVMTVSKVDAKLGKNVDGCFVPYNYTFGQRSQDIESLYTENGLLYITKASKIRDGIILAQHNKMLVVHDELPIIDIDTEADFKNAVVYYNNLKNR